MKKGTTSLQNSTTPVVVRLLLLIVGTIIGINLGKLLGIGLFKLIMWLHALPALEKFFDCLIFV